MTMRRAPALVAVAILGMAGASLLAHRVSASDSSLANLASDDPDTREAAIQAIVDAGTSQISGCVSSIKDDTSLVVKAGLAEAIARLGVSSDAATSVKSLLASTDPAVRQVGAWI